MAVKNITPPSATQTYSQSIRSRVNNVLGHAKASVQNSGHTSTITPLRREYAAANNQNRAEVRIPFSREYAESQNYNPAPKNSTVNPAGDSTAPETPVEPQNTNEPSPAPAPEQPAPEPERPVEPKADDKNDIKVEELLNKLKENTLSTGELDALKDYADKTGDPALKQQLDSYGKEPETPNFKQIQDDPDSEKDKDDDKFDIQQGDFIDFLMKDVVLATAAWAGKHASGFVNMQMYEIASWTHGVIKEHVTDPGKEKALEYGASILKNIKHAFHSVGEYEFKSKFTENDETTKFGNTVIDAQNGMMTTLKNSFGKAGSVPDIEVFNRLSKKLINGEITFDINDKDCVFIDKAIIENNAHRNSDLYWQDKESGISIPIGSEAMQQLLYQTSKYAEGLKSQISDPAELQQYLNATAKTVAQTAQTNFMIESSKKIFVQNMTTANMLHSKALDKDFNPSDHDKLIFEENAQKTFLKEYINIQNGKSEFKDFNELLAASGKAAKTAYKNIENGNYAEKNKVPTNEVLDKLNGITPKEDKTPLQSLQNEASQYIMASANADKLLADANNNIDAIRAQKDENDARRQLVQNTRARIAGKTAQNTNAGNTGKPVVNHAPAPRVTQNQGSR